MRLKVRQKGNKNREILIDALKAIVNNPFKESFHEKRKKKQLIF